MIFARNPETLDDAYKIIEDARQQNYTFLGSTRKSKNNKPNYRTNFSDDNQNSNEQLTIAPQTEESNKGQQNNSFRSGRNYERNNYSKIQESQRQTNDISASTSTRLSTNSRNSQSSVQNKPTVEPMDMNQSSVNI